MQTYLSLLGLSQKDATLEASCGALQNLTASKGLVSTKKIIVRLVLFKDYLIDFREKQQRHSRINDSTPPFTRRTDWFCERGRSFGSI